VSIFKVQRAMGIETFALTTSKHKGSTSAEETVDGWHFFRTLPTKGLLTKVPALNEWLLMRETTARLEEVVERVKPDVLHAHSPVLNAIPALRVGRRHGLPVVYEVRAFWEDAAVNHGTAAEGGLRYRLGRALESYALRRTDAITAICEGLRNDIVARGIPAEKVTLVPNAADVEEFRTGGGPDLALKKSLGLENKTVIGFVGSFYAYEGLDLLIKALPRVSSRIPDAKVLLVGGGPHERALRRLAEELGLADSVLFAGRVPHHDVARYYNLIDLLTYPRHSMRLTELVTPLKPLEAMAQGKLFIASDVGGHRELIRNNETGFLFKAGDADAFADKIVAVLSDRSSSEAVRSAARRYVETERNWEKIAARYEPIYRRLCDRT
jgi:PEP-CTERM/exosortase A-associated glycosyltransferase